MLNIRLKTGQAGLTALEMMIGVVLIGLLMAVAAPSFQAWTRNAQIRNAAESVANGLQRARAEAVMRNATVEFTLGAGSSWTISRLDPPNPPILVESKASSDGSKEVAVVARAPDLLNPAATITFSSLGTVIANADGTPAIAQIDFTSAGGNRNLRVIIGVGGNAKMCDPNIATGLTACI
jgi:type IV fimbrial biogenesis protein FimT